MPFNDLREFIEAAREIGDLKEIHGAHWDLEIGALTEIFASRDAMSPDKKNAADFTSSRAIVNACRPYVWKDQFPPVNALSPELRKRISEKWKAELE